ncbi:MAG: biotin synthase BioB [Planctomycetota bacterium]
MTSPSLEEDTRRPWTREEARELYHLPLPELVFRAQLVHRRHHDPRKVQLCSLLSIKTGGCSEPGAPAPPRAPRPTPAPRDPLIHPERVVEPARAARAAGATRLCMGAAWRSPRSESDFEAVLRMVRAVRAEGLEACCTLGFLTDEQARRLAEAGLTSYNHNLDTGPEYYPRIVTTHRYEDRLATLARVQAAGIQVCSGGIIGMGESVADRIDLLLALAGLDPPPSSIPINLLVPVEGTPLAALPPVDPIEAVRMVATARIVLPRSRVRLSAGRERLSDEAQALSFVAGANSIFVGERLLTAPNRAPERDQALFEKLGLEPLDG